MDDVLVRWPMEATRRDELRASGHAALIGCYGSVVSREALARAGWPAGAPGRNALDVHMLRLRRRLSPVALVIRTVRSRGHLLERRALGTGRPGT